MVARFSSHKAMVFAYSDLLALGIPASALRPHFDEVASAPQPPEEHHRFLQRLHKWFQARSDHSSMSQEVTQVGPERPSSPTYKESGGTLDVDPGSRGSAVVAIIVHHSGELVD